MSPLPSADREVAELERFCALKLPPALAGDTKLLELRQNAQRLALRLANPVRIAIVGLPGSGKSTLASFLAGHDYALGQSDAGRKLPVILRYGEKLSSLAGWWSGIEIPQSNADLAAAAENKPDYIELRLPNPILQFISFLDVPGAADWEAQKEQVRWVTGRTDIVIWCTNSQTPWVDDEWQLWSLVPKRLQARSVLVATCHDKALEPANPPLAERLAEKAKGQFQDVVAIATLAALEAAPYGKVLDAVAWQNSGAKAMVGALLAAGRAVRQSEILLARSLLSAALQVLDQKPRGAADAPAAEKTSSGSGDAAPPAKIATQGDASTGTAGTPASKAKPIFKISKSVDGKSAKTSAPTAAAAKENSGSERAAPAKAAPAPKAGATSGAAERVPRAAILDQFVRRIDSLIAYAGAPDSFKDWEFMSQVSELADELSQRIAEPGVLRDEGNWVRPQVEEAFVTLSLLQMEPGERPCRDAATVILQLSRDLAWAVVASEDA